MEINRISIFICDFSIMLMNLSVFKGFLGETRRGLAGFRSLMIGLITFFSDDIITEAFFCDMIGPNNVQIGIHNADVVTDGLEHRCERALILFKFCMLYFTFNVHFQSIPKGDHMAKYWIFFF